MHGPFAGMRYLDLSVGSCFIPKLLGTYERELASKIEWICERQPGLVIDVGAAEGYYAIGLALRVRQARVVAFELDEEGQAALSAMARLNGVTDRLGRARPLRAGGSRRGARGASGSCRHLRCRGRRGHAARSGAVAGLRRAVVLVEIHEFVRRGVSEELCRRFARSHDVERIWQEPRSRPSFPGARSAPHCCPRSYLDWAVSEWRPERMSWLWMIPKTIDA